MIALELLGRFAEPLAGLVIVVCSVLAFAAMSRRTRHCFRFVYGVLGVAGLVLVLDPFFKEGLAPWARLAVVLGLALHLVLDRRRIRPDKDPPARHDAPALPASLAAIALAAVLLFLVHAPTQAQDVERVAIHCGVGVCVIPEDIANRLIAQSNQALELVKRCPPGARL